MGSLLNIRCQDCVFQNIQAVVFDKDGTLADSHAFLWKLGNWRLQFLEKQVPGIQASLRAAFGMSNGKVEPMGLLAIGTRRENEIAAAAYLAAAGYEWIEALTSVRTAFRAADRELGRKADETPLFAGVLQTLQKLCEADCKIGMLSADTTANVKDFVKRYQLESYFHLQQGTDDQPGKPDPFLFWQACQKFNVAPQQVLMIGDSSADIEMARAAGAAGCIAVAWGWTPPTQLRGASVTISHLNEIQIERI
jgi:phosphoglycolate phosphatase